MGHLLLCGMGVCSLLVISSRDMGRSQPSWGPQQTATRGLVPREGTAMCLWPVMTRSVCALSGLIVNYMKSDCSLPTSRTREELNKIQLKNKHTTIFFTTFSLMTVSQNCECYNFLLGHCSLGMGISSRVPVVPFGHLSPPALPLVKRPS